MIKLRYLFSILLLSTNIAYADIETLSTTDASVQSLYTPNGNVVAGNPNGTVTLVDFFGYQCEFCRTMTPMMQSLIKSHPNLRVVYKEYLVFGDASRLSAYAALAAAKQHKYLAMHDKMITANKPLTQDELIKMAKEIGLNVSQFKTDMAREDIKQAVEANTALASEVGVTAAPTIVVAPTRILKSSQGVAQYKLFFPINPDTLNEMIEKAQHES
jgi:protein-disulfide isomerase